MILTKDNFKLFAAKHYDNPFCLTEGEFESDLFKASVIKKLLTAYKQSDDTNIRLLVNTTISFFNVFEHHAATKILEFKLGEDQFEYMNSILIYLSLPTVRDDYFNNRLLIRVYEEYK